MVDLKRGGGANPDQKTIITNNDSELQLNELKRVIFGDFETDKGNWTNTQNNTGEIGDEYEEVDNSIELYVQTETEEEGQIVDVNQSIERDINVEGIDELYLEFEVDLRDPFNFSTKLLFDNEVIEEFDDEVNFSESVNVSGKNSLNIKLEQTGQVESNEVQFGVREGAAELKLIFVEGLTNGYPSDREFLNTFEKDGEGGSSE